MIWKSIVSPRAIAPACARWTAISGFARKTAETASDFASVAHNLGMDVILHRTGWHSKIRQGGAWPRLLRATGLLVRC